MAGRRPLSHSEERQLLRVVRDLAPRDRALVTAQWMTGFRISEILSLTVGSVLRDETVVDKIGVAPRHMKGKRGTTRWVPVLPELRRALESWIGHMRRRWVLTPDLPLFLSRENNADGTARGLSRHTLGASSTPRSRAPASPTTVAWGRTRSEKLGRAMCIATAATTSWCFAPR